MDFELNDSQIMLRESVSRFLSKEYSFNARRKIVASKDGFSRDIWRGFAELGLLGVALPEFAGGLAEGPIERAIIMEAFGRALVVEPYLAAITLGASIVARLGDDAQCAAILPGVISGGYFLAFAHGEPGRNFLNPSLTTSARRSEEGWVIDGQKTLVLGAAAADDLIVSATLEDDGIGATNAGLFVIAREAPGVSITSYRLLDGAGAGDILLRGVRVSEAARLGREVDVAAALDNTIDNAIADFAADALGVIEALIEATAEYAKTRVQFGRPIAEFQALQHRMADMAVLREEARSLTILAALSLNASPIARARAVSAAKIKVGRAAKLIAEHAIQIHGAMGVTEELNIGAYLKRALVFAQLFGSVEDHQRRYADLSSRYSLWSQSPVEMASESPINQIGSAW